jgi:hypothetical protein
MLSSHFLPLLSRIAILVHRALSDVVAVNEDTSRDEAKEITCALTNENTRRQELINDQ